MQRRRLATALLGALLTLPALVGAACKPNLDETVSLVTTPQVLGVQATPAEAAPSASMTFTALVVDPSGELDTLPIEWDFCNARNPLANLGPVSPQCSQQGNANLAGVGIGPQATGTVPDIACRNFGPEVPPTTGNQTPGRPVDPDPTGGYYQPVSLFVPTAAGTVTSIYGARIACGLAQGTSEQVSDFLGRYHANANPVVASVTANGTALVPAASGTNGLPAGQKVTLEVSWPACPLSDACGDGICGADESVTSCAADCTTPQGCGGAERYVDFDLGSQSLVDAREGVHVSWFATDGSFDLDRTGREGSDTTTTSDDGWTPPAQAGQMVHLWVVLHDDRGGTGWAGFVVETQ